MSSKCPCLLNRPYFGCESQWSIKEFPLLAFLKFQSYFPLSFLSTALKIGIKTSPQEDRSPMDPSLGLRMEGQELNQSKGRHRRMKYLKKPMLMAADQLPRPTASRKRHIGELRKMHSCKVTAKSICTTPTLRSIFHVS